MRFALLVVLAGCPSHDDAVVLSDAAPTPDAVLPACADTSAPPVTIEDLAIESCDLRGLDTALLKDLAVGADGALYILSTNGEIERFAPAASGCSFTRDDTFVPPPSSAGIEATAEGRLYTARREGNSSVLAWQGSSTGQCSSTALFKPTIAAANDGSIVLAPGSGAGLTALDTATCTTTPIAVVATETPRVFGRAGTDLVWGGPVATGIGRASLAGTVKYALTDHSIGGRDEIALEQLGSRIASWALGYLFSVDAATGAAHASIEFNQFFAAGVTRAAPNNALFDAAPDGQTAFVLAVDTPTTGACAVVPYLYRLTAVR